MAYTYSYNSVPFTRLWSKGQSIWEPIPPTCRVVKDDSLAEIAKVVLVSIGTIIVMVWAYVTSYGR